MTGIDETREALAARTLWLSTWMIHHANNIRPKGTIKVGDTDFEAKVKAGSIGPSVIDIGALDVAVLAGYPGTIAATWQRAGRAGRRSGLSAAVLVASSAPIDQYVVRHPSYFFERSPEHALINPDNLMLLLDHVRCAAFELPFSAGEGFGRSPFVADALQLLAEEGELHAHEKEARGLVVVLRGFFDVATVLQQKTRDGVYQPEAIRAGEGQHIGVVHARDCRSRAHGRGGGPGSRYFHIDSLQHPPIKS